MALAIPVVGGAARASGLLLVLLLASGLAGCTSATPYQPADGGYGYSEQQLEQNRFRVAFAGNEMTPRETVQDYLLYRAAELTLAQGHDHFTVVDRAFDRSTTYHGSGVGDFWWPRWHSDRAFGSPFGTYTAFPIDSYSAFADIVMGDGDKPPGEVNAYDARDVLRQLGPRIERPADQA